MGLDGRQQLCIQGRIWSSCLLPTVLQCRPSHCQRVWRHDRPSHAAIPSKLKSLAHSGEHNLVDIFKYGSTSKHSLCMVVWMYMPARFVGCSAAHCSTLSSTAYFVVLAALLQHRRTPARKLLATATAVAVSTGGQAVSQSVANGTDAASSSQATSSGNSTALSIGIANGTSTVANSSAHATGKHAWTLVMSRTCQMVAI